MVDTDDTRRTTPRVWHKLPTGELKMIPSDNKIQRPGANLEEAETEVRCHQLTRGVPVNG